MKVVALIGSLMFLTAASVHAGPFGLSQGETLEALSKKLKLKPNEIKYSYTATTVPNPHPEFDDYRLIITPQYGLCKVIAWTPSINMNSFGNEAISKFDSIEAAITREALINSVF